MKDSGGLTFLDSGFNPASDKKLPGLVVQDFYLKETGLWLLFTVTSAQETPESNLIFYDLKTGETTSIPLNGPPAAYRFNEDRNELAVGTLGNPKKNVPAELALIDLTQKQVKNFPVSANPGAIYRTASGKIVVACGGFRNNQKYSSTIRVERTSSAELAKLHWIDTTTGQTEITQLGYSPLLIDQDQKDSETFYAVCANVYADPNGEPPGITLGGILNSGSNQPAATFYKVASAKIDSGLKLQNQPKSLIQSSCGSVCLQGDKELSIIDVSGPSPKLLDYKHDKDIDEFLISRDGTVGYLANANSNYLNIIDLKTGKEIKTLQISKTFFIGNIFFDFFKNGFPPVIQPVSAEPPETANCSENRRMFFSKDFSHLYILAGAPEVCDIDLQTNQVKSAIKFFDTQYGIHPTPNGKFIAVTANNGWYLLDPSKTKPVFNLSLKPEDSEPGAEYGYYSPDGNLLVVPFKNYLYLIDPVQGISRGKTRTGAVSPLIVWPE